jgi:Holin of 3TMs, for gene-transfer release
MAFDLTGLGSLFDFGGKIIDRLFPDPDKAQAAKIELFKLQQSGELAVLAAETDLMKGQLAVNEAEAKSTSIFVSGWRPFIGWVCGSAFAMNFVIGPIVTFVFVAVSGKVLAWPTLDWATIMPVLLGMLGLGGMRSYEKAKGVTK